MLQWCLLVVLIDTYNLPYNKHFRMLLVCFNENRQVTWRVLFVQAVKIHLLGFTHPTYRPFSRENLNIMFTKTCLLNHFKPHLVKFLGTYFTIV